MKKSRLYRVNRFLGQLMTSGKCPNIRWNDVVRIEAFGTDVVSAFAIVVVFHYRDGSNVAIHPEQKGYYKIIESLDKCFASISADWFEGMQLAGKYSHDVERVLYSHQVESSSK